MIDYDLIAQKDELYKLSRKGEIVVENVESLLNTIEVFERNFDYWKTHDLTSIPDFLLNRIDELGHFELLEPSAEHLAETPNILLENMLASKEIFTFVSYFHPEAPSIYAELAEKEAEITVCMTENVAKRLFSGSQNETEKLYKAKNLKMFLLREKVRIPAIIVSDLFLAFKLFENDGKLRDQLVLCFGEKAMLWGKSLISYIISTSDVVPLRLEDFESPDFYNSLKEVSSQERGYGQKM
jgi:predicted transcriptional regulator